MLKYTDIIIIHHTHIPEISIPEIIIMFIAQVDAEYAMMCVQKLKSIFAMATPV